MPVWQWQWTQHWHWCHASQPVGLNCTGPIIWLHHWGHRWMRTQCTVYLFSGDSQVQMRSLITSRLETLRQKCSANICRLKSSRQKISVLDTGVHHPKLYLVGKWHRLPDDQMHVLKTGFYRAPFLCFEIFCFQGYKFFNEEMFPFRYFIYRQ